jgi:hypothetical protein
MTRRTLLAIALCHVACGGSVAAGGGDYDSGSADARHIPSSDSGHDSAAPDTGHDGGAPWSPVCPEQLPAIGSPCTIPDPMDSPEILCEYGPIQYDINCSMTVQCDNGQWASGLADPSSCQPDGPNTAACPASYEALMAIPNSECSDTNLRCEYPEGVCVCSSGFDVVEIDGGTTWSCNPGPGCPVPRPRVGSSCSTNVSCTYETCDFGESCSGGYWQVLFEGCAGAGG